MTAQDRTSKCLSKTLLAREYIMYSQWLQANPVANLLLLGRNGVGLRNLGQNNPPLPCPSSLNLH